MMSENGIASARKTSIAIAVLFQATCAAAIIGGSMLDAAKPAASGGYPPEAAFGALLWFVNDLGMVFIAALAYPIVRRKSEGLALAYFGIRIVECMPLVIGAMASLAALKAADGSGALAEIAWLCFTPLTRLFLGVGGLLFSALLLGSRALPAWLAIFGLVSYAILPVVAVLDLLGLSGTGVAGMLPMLPVIALEIIVLPGWLYIKGFSSPRA
jgi:hypothetical protein